MSGVDVAIVGSGPAGAACAISCANAGLTTLLLEREQFPREKVCGDCINPSCWPVLERMRVRDEVLNCPHGTLRFAELIDLKGKGVRITLPTGPDAEIAIKRSLLDQLLMDRARTAGVDVREGMTVTAVSGDLSGWSVTANGEEYRAKILVAADGRNSTVARLCNLLPRVPRERLGLQTHIPCPADFGERVVLQLLPQGYSGQAPVGSGELNLCLVAPPAAMPAMKGWAERRFNLDPRHTWRTITPLSRAALPAAREGLFLVGDAARVVEPFTGEGIYYALRSGELAADAIARQISGATASDAAGAYMLAHETMYRGRLWVNRLARAAVLFPRLSSAVLQGLRFQPALLRWLASRVIPTHRSATPVQP